MLEMRRRILTILPGVNEVVSYGMAAFRLGDVTVCGLLAAKHHVGYYPFSGTVLPRLTSALEKYTTTKSALHVPVDRPLSRALLKKLIDTRLSQQPVRARSRDTSVIQRSDGEWCGIGLAPCGEVVHRTNSFVDQCAPSRVGAHWSTKEFVR